MITEPHWQLLNKVIDGVASDDERAELVKLASSDDEIAAQYENISLISTSLNNVPALKPPTTLIDSVLKKIDALDSEKNCLAPGQLFSRSRVIESQRQNVQVSTGRTSQSKGFFQSILTLVEAAMNKANFFSGMMGKALVGGGIAAAAIVTVTMVGFPENGNDTVGTIVPAERFRATQNTAADIQVGSPSGTQSAQLNASASDATNAAANNAANRASNEAANKASNEAANKASNEAANRASNEAANKASNEAANKASNEAANKASNEAANRASNEAANKAANEAANKASNEAANKAANNAANKASNEAANKAANNAMKQ